MSLVGRFHATRIFPRRIRRLSEILGQLLPHNASVLDVGCGDGCLSARIQQTRPDLRISGVEVLVRPITHIPVKQYDGVRLPYPDQSYDVVMFVDVLHHTSDPLALLREAARVARQSVVIKDHTREGLLARLSLRVMDYVGNAHHGVACTYNFWSRKQWTEAWRSIQVEPRHWNSHLNLYFWPLSLACDRSLHFVACLQPRREDVSNTPVTSSPGASSTLAG